MTHPATLPPMQLVHPDVTRTCAESEVYETLLALDGATILELGCGKADHTRRIAAAHPAATIIATEVDRIQHAINLATDVPSNMRFADFGAESIALPDASVDVVMMFKSLHHVPTPLLDEALNEIARVLRPGGLAYISEPLFAGPFNEVIRIFNDEQAVRKAAFDALGRSVDRGQFELASEVFFLLPVKYRDFADFAKRHFDVTHSERNVTEAQRMATERQFNLHLGPDGADFRQQIRVDLLRKPR